MMPKQELGVRCWKCSRLISKGAGVECYLRGDFPEHSATFHPACIGSRVRVEPLNTKIQELERKLAACQQQLKETQCPIGLSTPEICSAGTCMNCLRRKLKAANEQLSRYAEDEKGLPLVPDSEKLRGDDLTIARVDYARKLRAYAIAQEALANDGRVAVKQRDEAIERAEKSEAEQIRLIQEVFSLRMGITQVEAELDALKHDIARHVQHNSQLIAERDAARRDERERCAKVCDELHYAPTVLDGIKLEAYRRKCAAAIRNLTDE